MDRRRYTVEKATVIVFGKIDELLSARRNAADYFDVKHYLAVTTQIYAGII